MGQKFLPETFAGDFRRHEMMLYSFLILLGIPDITVLPTWIS